LLFVKGERMSFLRDLFGKKNSDCAKIPVNIESHINSNDLNHAIIEIDNYFGKLCAYGEEMEKLNEYQKVFYLNQCLERELNNGGFNQFYFNFYGKYAEETVASLKVIGAIKTADILFQANSIFPTGNVPIDSKERQNILEKIEKSGNDKWQRLEEKFMTYEEDLNSLNMNYIRTNKEAFINNK
jgi:hypothetical protein